MGAHGVGVAVGHDVNCSRSHPTFCMVKHAATVTAIPRTIAIKRNFIPRSMRSSPHCRPVSSFLLQPRILDVVLPWPSGLSLKVRNVESVNGPNQTKPL